MTAISWKNAVNGDWSTAADWSTGTVPSLTDAVTISVAGAYIVTISSADLANSLTFNAFSAALYENSGSLTMVGALTVDSGFVSLNRANTIGSVALAGGVLAFGNAGALGTGTVTVSGGELLATATETLTNALTFSGTSTIAAAHGTTLNENAPYYGVNANSTLNFGALGQDGTILWHTGAGSSLASPYPIINIQAGTLKGADSLFYFFIGGASQVIVAAGATLDLAGNSTGFTDLTGGGAVIDSGAAATLTLDAANFSGVIAGPLSLVAAGAVILGGANTYTGTTTINSTDSLSIDSNNAVTFTNTISGAGTLKQIGTGITSINTANNYSGGTTLAAGTLAIGNGGALGGGTLTFTGGELLGTATETFADPLNLSLSGSTTTFAAAHGTTLDLTGGVTFAGNTVDIGAPGQDGDIIWSGVPFGSATDTFDVLDGTLTAGNSELEFLLLNITGTTVAAGATLDWAGNTAEINDLSGAGTVTNSGAAQTMFLIGTTNFSGTISGDMAVYFLGNASLSGLEDYAYGATIAGTVANTGTYDMVGNAGIAGSPTTLFVNNGLFEKSGGVSDVTSNFINSGTLDVLSGSIQFSGGFTNNGTIHGIVTQSGGVTTISAPVTDDFNGDGTSDLLIQNSSGNLVDWIVQNGVMTSGNNINNPSLYGYSTIHDSYSQEALTGDFNGDGTTDILLQNSSGSLTDWIIKNGTLSSGTNINNPAAYGYSVIGTGDFNGDGTTDILLQNSSGNLVDWTIQNGSLASGNNIGNPAAYGYSVVGTGDFNGDGTTDILLENSSGNLADWTIQNGMLVGGNNINNPSAYGYQLVGTGDFNGDGTTDLLLQSDSNGSLTDWIIKNGTLSSGNNIGNPVAAGYSFVGTGDYNGDGTTDILLQNGSGNLVDWTIKNGTLSTGYNLGNAAAAGYHVA
jgi:autotransporter-associated beta strand protein